MTTFPNVLCVGMHFRGAAAVDVAANLEVDSSVNLVREPENQYDAYAIKVLVEDIHIGYIERGQAAWISPLMDEGGTATATITGHETRKNNVHPLLEIVVE